MTTKEKINEVINDLESTAKTCEISTVAEIKNNLKSAISKLQAVEAETASGDKSLNSTNYKVLFIFNRICALKAEKQQIAETMGAKWLSSNIADEYNNTIYGLLEEIEKLAGADAERK